MHAQATYPKNKMEEPNFEWATRMLLEGHKVRLPEWRGYWFKNQDGHIKALTKDGDIVDASANVFHKRIDWEIAEGLDFGWAICALKAGKLVTRKGWNGKGMFLFIRPADELPEQMVIDQVKSLPKSLKDYYKQSPISNQNEGSIRFTAYICMKAADGTIVNGWLASQTDMLAEDWQLFES